MAILGSPETGGLPRLRLSVLRCARISALASGASSSSAGSSPHAIAARTRAQSVLLSPRAHAARISSSVIVVSLSHSSYTSLSFRLAGRKLMIRDVSRSVKITVGQPILQSHRQTPEFCVRPYVHRRHPFVKDYPALCAHGGSRNHAFSDCSGA